MTGAAELLADWRAVYAELHPKRDPAAMLYSEAMLSLGVLLRRELRLAAGPALRQRVIDRLAAYDRTDPE